LTTVNSDRIGRPLYFRRITRIVMARCSRHTAIDPRSADMTNKLTTVDVVVLGGLAAVFCWTYIVLPLAFYRG
jgi:hypothetical protein